ncbi:MAG: hypothetical protein OXE77_09815 [Flavobacteriaceae bacterium]|nr:hypothetical protein [Flavobacteriaceae bacterium]MCY4266899.1 hypothetical protein [Flavobacteriaceae bacterium]MCY4299329.1 hypothetical protein [Flavobacteriaceae bacterium]
MKNFEPHHHVLSQLKNLISNLSVEELTKKSDLLYNASIGEHFRHIIEFYRCCLFFRKEDVVNYDLRPRDKTLENEPSAGINAINELLTQLQCLSHPEKIILNLQSECIVDAGGIATNLDRELAFCLDHCIHHQSIIKIGLKASQLDHLVDKNFGVAFSTQTYREKCAS